MPRSVPLLLLLLLPAHLTTAALLPGSTTRTAARPAVGHTTATRALPLHSRTLLVAAEGVTAPAGNARGVAVAWGVFGFLGILASAIKRLLPLALQPLTRRDLTWLQWGLFGGTMVGFAYVEGYGAFQKKFSPLVVQRAMTLNGGGGGRPLHVALAPFYSMGLFHATKRRRTISWSVSLSVAMLVGLVKRLPYPWRSIVDAGVCTGLCWGGASIVAFYARALFFGTAPGVSPELPTA